MNRFCRGLLLITLSFAVSLPLKADDGLLGQAFEQKQSGVQIQGEGEVIRLLSDDTKGSRHQRFILRLASGQTLLVAHNIDLAPRIAVLKVDDCVGSC